MRDAEPDPDDDALPESKTRRKKDMLELQALGEALVAISGERLHAVPMPDALRDAVLEAQRIRQRGAKRRQLQYIGRLMREVDAEPIRRALDEFAGRSREHAARQHRLEHLREQLLEDETILQQLAEQWPGADLQQLRVQRRNALKERQLGKAPKAYRQLFRLLRELDDGADRPRWEAAQEEKDHEG
ncbi:MAG: DUF615 domain-containing protein [Rhodocyclaceae bacterium]|nr:DUF615 domain-containing protein [Rhodocyclaceae bacterium]